MEEKPGLVSIIMAAYNAEKTISIAINSILTQTYTDWELLVINDCSKDRTAEVVASFTDPRIRLLNNESNSGVSVSRKKGMEAATGEWIAVLDSDDAWTSDKLEKQIKLAKETGEELIFTGSAFMDDDGNPIDWQLHVPTTLTYRELLKQNLVSNSSVLVKADLYRKHYAIGDGMHEDFAIWLGITREGKDAYGIDEPLLIYRVAKSSKSSNKMKAAKMNWNTYRYVGLNPVAASYYMCWYIVKGLLKYRHLK
ncbi:MAG: glycosyltransferase family 2 protein [Christensenellales bacterium]|jgi:teichuronic acid biosynthesis glycosyltransferase TuaG